MIELCEHEFDKKDDNNPNYSQMEYYLRIELQMVMRKNHTTGKFEITRIGNEQKVYEGTFQEMIDKVNDLEGKKSVVVYCKYENINPSILRRDLNRLKEIQNQMTDLISDAKNTLIHYETVSERANAYWIGHISSALSDESEYCGTSMTTLEDTIKELEEIGKHVIHNDDCECSICAEKI